MDPTRAALRKIARSFGYDPDTVVSVYMDQWEARVKYRVEKPDGGFTVQEDGFFIADPPQTAPINVAPAMVGTGTFAGEGTLTAGSL